MKLTESARKTSKSKSSSTKKRPVRLPRLNSPELRFVVCVKGGVNVDVEPFRVYKVKADRTARSQGLLRVVDDSGEDYLYPAEYFKPIIAPQTLFQSIDQS
jgi:hypothetical protein